jgi:hypothetical protein
VQHGPASFPRVTLFVLCAISTRYFIRAPNSFRIQPVQLNTNKEKLFGRFTNFNLFLMPSRSKFRDGIRSTVICRFLMCAPNFYSVEICRRSLRSECEGDSASDMIIKPPQSGYKFDTERSPQKR